MKRVLVVGGGASGMMAAISAAKEGAQVTIYEKTDKIGKKILATGNGKCNLSNENMELNNFYSEDKEKLCACLERFSTRDTVRFFEELGLMIRSKGGYLYPYCEQASAVLEVLKTALKRNNVIVETSVKDIIFSVKRNGVFLVTSPVGKKEFDAIILACGSKAGIKNAVTEGYDYAKLFGHRIIPLQPALVQVRCSGNFFKSIAGVRCKAELILTSNGVRIAKEYGELQLTDYGISGIPVFQMSRLIARELQHKNKVDVLIDFVPDVAVQDWNEMVKQRIKSYQGYCCEEFLTGMIHKKLSLMLLKEFGLKAEDVVSKKTENTLLLLCKKMKGFCVNAQSMNPFEQAQVCCGGVDFTQLDENMQSIFQPGVFFCGEMIDVDGKCGGYNLQWAWTSGYIAGVSSAR